MRARGAGARDGGEAAGARGAGEEGDRRGASEGVRATLDTLRLARSYRVRNRSPAGKVSEPQSGLSVFCEMVVPSAGLKTT